MSSGYMACELVGEAGAPADVPAIQAKILNGGEDAEAWAFIRHLADNVYPYETWQEFLEYNDFGIIDIPALGMAAHINLPPDQASMDKGHSIMFNLAPMRSNIGTIAWRPGARVRV